MKAVWTFGAVFFLAIVAQSQSPAPVTGIGGGTGIVSANVQGFSLPTGLKGAPFSADTIHETDRALADGNRIHQETHGRTFRDSEGRTRTESEYILPNGEKLHNVTIHDLVAGTIIHLDERTKTATISHFPPLGAPSTAPRTAPKPATPVTRPSPPRLSMTSEDLGTMTIEGFVVTGTRHTRTTPAGEIGNEQPIVVVSESWSSPDLKVVLLSKTDDPQYGKSTTKLVNVRAGEPDPSLFQIPSDYTVTDNSLQNK